ncbi:MAG: hypothetical protein HC836_22705 [Richelia sp. RM2_1_2]|nr:hypothetical protein [Richelia sp. RM2_1_2]
MTPRSGSTLIQLLMYYYLNAKYKKCTNLKNYFNIYHYNMFFENLYNGDNKFIGKKNHPIYNSNKKLYKEEAKILHDHAELIYNYNITGAEPNRNIIEETHHRLNCIINSDIDHLLCVKLHAFPELHVVYDYAIKNNWFIVCTERDPTEQMLEYFISLDKQIWAFFKISTDDIKNMLPKAKSITLKRELVEKFLQRLKNYYIIKNKFLNPVTIKFEYLKNITSIWDCYTLLGFNDWEEYVEKDKIFPELPVRIPFGCLENYFTNADEAKEWCNTWKIQNNIL